MPGMKITKIYPRSAAERVGLHEGDIVRSINDYLTQQPGNLEVDLCQCGTQQLAEDDRHHRK